MPGSIRGRASATGLLLCVAALLATISSANASILSASRISFAMGEDKILHPWASQLHRH